MCFRGMFMRFCGVLFAFGMIAFFMMLRSGVVRLGRVFVMLSGFLMMFFGHVVSTPCCSV